MNMFPHTGDLRADPFKRQATRQSISSTGMKAIDFASANNGKGSKFQPGLDSTASDFHD